MTAESNQSSDLDAEGAALRQRVAELEQQFARLVRAQEHDVSQEDRDYFFTLSPDMLCVTSFAGYFQ